MLSNKVIKKLLILLVLADKIRKEEMTVLLIETSNETGIHVDMKAARLVDPCSLIL